MSAPTIRRFGLAFAGSRWRWNILHEHPAYGAMVSRGCAMAEADAWADLMLALWRVQLWAPRP